MEDVKIEYAVLKDEFHGLVVIASKNSKKYKLYISTNLLERNQLTFWMDADYYKTFLDTELKYIVKGIENENYQIFRDGFSVGEIF